MPVAALVALLDEYAAGSSGGRDVGAIAAEVERVLTNGAYRW